MFLKDQKGPGRKFNLGYTSAVDYWSLGCTMFVLLSGGLRPFPNLNAIEVVTRTKNDPQYMNGVHTILSNPAFSADQLPKEYMYMYEGLTKLQVAQSTLTFIIELLDFNEFTRLGASSSGGGQRVKDHPYFSYYVRENSDPRVTRTDSAATAAVVPNSDGKHFGSLSHFWDECAHKSVTPPCLPPPAELDEHVHPFMSYEDMLFQAKKSSWLKQVPSVYYNEYFDNWYVPSLECVYA